MARARLVKAIPRGLEQALPVGGGLLGGVVASNLVDKAVAKAITMANPEGKIAALAPGGAFDKYGLPLVGGAGALILAELAVRQIQAPWVSKARLGVYTGVVVDVLRKVASRVPALNKLLGVNGLGILVAETPSSLEAIVAEVENSGSALMALSDGTLAEIVAETDGLGEGFDVDSGGFGAVDVNSGGFGSGALGVNQGSFGAGF